MLTNRKHAILNALALCLVYVLIVGCPPPPPPAPPPHELVGSWCSELDIMTFAQNGVFHDYVQSEPGMLWARGTWQETTGGTLRVEANAVFDFASGTWTSYPSEAQEYGYAVYNGSTLRLYLGGMAIATYYRTR